MFRKSLFQNQLCQLVKRHPTVCSHKGSYGVAHGTVHGSFRPGWHHEVYVGGKESCSESLQRLCNFLICVASCDLLLGKHFGIGEIWNMAHEIIGIYWHLFRHVRTHPEIGVGKYPIVWILDDFCIPCSWLLEMMRPIKTSVSFRSCLSSNRFCCRRNRWFCSTRTGGASTLGFPDAWSIVQATKLIIIN